MSDLAALKTRLAQSLADTGNNIWDANALAEALRTALHEYSKTRPLQAVDTLDLSAAGRELDISSLTGLLAVTDLWLPYTAADPEYPPNRLPFRLWADLGLLYVLGDYEPEAGDVARVFCTALQTIEDLDTATATTVPGDDESLLIVGAAGYAATSRAVDLAEQVTIDRQTAAEIRAWGKSRLDDFRAGLLGIARRLANDSGAFVSLPPMDRWERDGGGWS